MNQLYLQYAHTIMHIEMDLEFEDAEALTKVALVLLRKDLPEYIVNCFVASGYDTLPIIAEMDISDEPGNTLQVIEQFIAKEYPNDRRFSRSTISPSSLFPPGHRRRIERFVNDVRKQLEEERKQLSRKRRTENHLSNTLR